MFGVLFSVCFVPAVVSIVVTDPPPTSTEYNYSYNVVDPRTGDAKSLYEKRRGDVITGSYRVIDPDGTHRIVEYTADSSKGFKAIVRSEPLAVPIQHALRDPYYFSRMNTRYLNHYYSSRTLYRNPVIAFPEPRTMKPASNPVGQKNNNEKKTTRYFTPSNNVKTEAISFKRGEYFAPHN